MLGTGGKPNLRTLLSRAQLPALPQSAVRLLELSNDAENGPAEYARPIEGDPGLTSQVLRFVNSSYFGFRQEISSVHLAISLVGVRTIKNFALWSAVFSVVSEPRCGTFCLKKLWQDSLRRGLFARAVAKRLNLPHAEDLFAIALLQDMAVPILAKELPRDYESLFKDRQDGQLRLSDLERERLGWCHGEAGAFLARNWRLPESFATTIERHAAANQRSGDADPESQVVRLSALLPSTCDPTWHERSSFLSAFHRTGSLLGLIPEEVFAEIDQAFSEFAPFLRISHPGQPLTGYLQPELASA